MAESRPHGTLGLRFSSLCVVVVLALLSTACNGATDPASEQEAAPTHLRVLMSDDWADTKPFVDGVRSFEQQHPGVRVQIDKLAAGDVLGTVDALIKQGTPPDVVQGHAFAAASRGLAQPVDDLWKASGLNDSEFLPGAVEDVMWGGRHYGHPLDTNALVLYYNARKFAAANLAPPDTWRTFGDMERAAQALSTPDGTRRALVLSTAPGGHSAGSVPTAARWSTWERTTSRTSPSTPTRTSRHSVSCGD